MSTLVKRHPAFVVSDEATLRRAVTQAHMLGVTYCGGSVASTLGMMKPYLSKYGGQMVVYMHTAGNIGWMRREQYSKESSLILANSLDHALALYRQHGRLKT